MSYLTTGQGFSHRERKQNLEQAPREKFDLLVIGGGVLGTGIARDAVLRGLKVCLLEQRDFGAGTSSRSTKLIHGGLRYLEHFEFGLVFESVQERGLLMRKLAPHLVRPMPFLIPVWNQSRYGMFFTSIGMALYDVLALFRNYRLHRRLSRKMMVRTEPALNLDPVKGGFIYYDAQTWDARLTLENALDAHNLGATLLSRTSVQDFILENGKVQGIKGRDEIDGTEFAIRTPHIINATGPFTDGLLGKLPSYKHPLLRPTKGVHIIVDREKFPVQHAITFFSAVDQRVMFTIPWGQFTLIGTTDTDSQVEPLGLATSEDVDYILNSVEGLLSQHSLTRGDVISTYAGWRPLIQDPDAENESEVSREHQVVEHPEGLLTIAGGKLTTYRRIAQEVVDKAVKYYSLPASPCTTHRRPLPGTPEPGKVYPSPQEGLQPYGRRWSEVETFLQTPEDRELLVPNLPYQKGEIRFFVHREMALNIADILCRRTDIALLTPDYAGSLAETVAEIMGEELGWSEEEKRRQVEEYTDFARRSAAWRLK